MDYTNISISDLRKQLPDIAERVARKGEIFAVEKWGKIKGYFVATLEDSKAVDLEEKMLAKRRKILKETAGIWKNRRDMSNSVAWVSKLRKRESSRYGKIFD
ncbi:MAG: hypothetical protein DPW11_01420 [bacterium]|nr:hypothetical protein [Candidatus Microgenomates bacterium CPR3]MCQ3944421.1 hypothetical protein [bacterium]RIK51683.1 MAG: hypothetical protein DCC61_01925 [Candidatus Microgenomates bacterium]